MLTTEQEKGFPKGWLVCRVIGAQAATPLPNLPGTLVMLEAPPAVANRCPFPVAALPLSAEARQALLPARLGSAWITARWLELAIDRLDLSCLFRLYRRRRGSWPFSPLLLLKLALFCIADGLSSPSHWAQLANRDGPCRWLIWGIEPSVAACYSFRDRLGSERLLEFNRQVLALAQGDGLTQARRGALDGTLQEANASRHHLVNARRLQQGLQALQQPLPASAVPPSDPQPDAQDQPPSLAKAPAQPTADTQHQPPQQPQTQTQPASGQPATKIQRRPVRPGPTQAGRDRQHQRWQAAQEQLQQRQQRNQQKRASKRSDPAKIVISPTDPQAAVGLDKRGVFRPLYNAQLMADLDSELILGYEAFAQQNDNGLLPGMLQRTEELVGHKLELTVVDAGYTGGQELSQAEQAGVVVLGPCAGQSQNEKAAAKQLPKSAFRYQAQRDVYVCPEGKTLERVGSSQQKRSSVELVVLTQYRCPTQQCQQCPSKQQCCPKSRQGRSISRSEHEDSIDRLRQRMSQPENKQTYKKRAASVERLFGDGKEQRGLDRVHGRGLEQARIQLALTVLQHNLRILGRAMEAARRGSGNPPRERRAA
jgi:Transposase DDE domain